MPYLHGKWPKYAIPYFKINEKIHLHLSDKVVVVSKDLFRYFKKFKNQKKIEYIPNGTNIHDLKTDPIKKKYRYAFVAGRIIYIKGLHLLLKAMHESNDSSKLLVIGDLYHEYGYKQNIIDPLSSRLDITFRDVIFKKEVLFQEIKSAELFIFPSLIEAMSTVLLEVAALRIPIICSDIVQNRDIFEDKEVLFFKSDDVADLKDKIYFASKNSNIMLQKAENAQKKVRSEFSWNNIGEKYKTAYNTLIYS
jgi:glycosyltransferase involved in cell wall biosynthesis